MSHPKTIAIVAAINLAGLAFFANAASAAVVCNSEGECWHANTEYAYPPGLRLEVHPNDWRWGDGERRVWREHDGRGYWGGGQWRDFQ